MTNEEYCKPILSFELYPVNLMEFVANMTHGPEPSAEEAAKWLDRHTDGLDDAFQMAFQAYVEEHWKGEECKSWNTEAL